MVFLEYSEQFDEHVRCEGVDRTAIQFHHQNMWTLLNQNVPGENARLPVAVTCNAHRGRHLAVGGIEQDACLRSRPTIRIHPRTVRLLHEKVNRSVEFIVERTAAAAEREMLRCP